MKKGHTLCQRIEEYTHAQVYFMLLNDEMIAESFNPNNTTFKISGTDSKKSILEKLKIWKKD